MKLRMKFQINYFLLSCCCCDFITGVCCVCMHVCTGYTVALDVIANKDWFGCDVNAE